MSWGPQTKTNGRYTKDKEKEIQAHRQGKSPVHKGRQEGKMREQRTPKQPESSQMASVSLCFLTITLKVNGIHSAIKRHRTYKWIFNTRSNCMLPTRNLLLFGERGLGTSTLLADTFFCFEEIHF